MTQPKITEAAWKRADELVVGGLLGGGYRVGLAQFIQTTSDVAKDITKYGLKPGRSSALSDLILPDEPDLLDEAVAAAWPSIGFRKGEMDRLRTEITKRGGTLTFTSPEGE